MLLPTGGEGVHDRVSLTIDSARLVRADRIVMARGNPADGARERGYRDQMMGLPLRRGEFGPILRVAYDQGVGRAKQLRDLLRGKPWTETEIVRNGSKWSWAVYLEGAYVASGDARTEKVASQTAEAAIIDRLDLCAGNAA